MIHVYGQENMLVNTYEIVCWYFHQHSENSSPTYSFSSTYFTNITCTASNFIEIFSAQALSRTEIERNDVKANSIGIFRARKGWIKRLEICVSEIPDFSFCLTKTPFNHRKFNFEINLPTFQISTDNHGFVVQSD